MVAPRKSATMRHGNSAARQAEDHQIRPILIFSQRLGQQTAGFYAVVEHHLAKD
jgi:hypothetical protein